MNLRRTMLWALPLAMAAGDAAARSCMVTTYAGGQAVVKVGNDEWSSFPVMAADCRQVAVIKGKVTVLYLDNAGRHKHMTLDTGERFKEQAAGAPGTFKVIFDVVTKAPRSVLPGRRDFEQTDDHGTPRGTVFVPAAGLPIHWQKTVPQARYHIVDAYGRSVATGPAAEGQRTVVAAAKLKPDAEYTLVLDNGGPKTNTAFVVADADTLRETREAIAEVDADAALDDTTRALARALVYEERSLSYNRQLALRELP